MNLSSFRTFLAFICSIGLISYVVAGPGQSGDHGRGSSSGPGFNQDNNPGQQGQSASDGTKFNSQTTLAKAVAPSDAKPRRTALPTRVRIRIQTRSIAAK